MSAINENVRDQVEAEREACIRILEAMRPTNDQSDWTSVARDRDLILSSAIAQIRLRYPA